MRSITKTVFMEDQYLGATLGAINLPHGLVLVDAPPSPEDARAWRAALLNLGASSERILVNLDAHPDRTLGARAMDCTIIAHEKTAHIFRTRPTTFKAQGDDSGADWEAIPGLGNVRWASPEVTFSQQMAIHWGDEPVFLEHHPGPTSGSIWVVYPQEKVVFVGDAVVKNQPPFLAAADLPAWLDSLKLLLSSTYKNWSVVSGRGGLVAVETIKAQKDYLETVQHKLDKLSSKKASQDAVEALVPLLLHPFKIPSSQLQKYTRRLSYGLHHYFARHNRPAGTINNEE
jgi:cyclase